MDARAILDAVRAAQREGGRMMLQARDIRPEDKTDHRDLVTQYDRAVQELLVERLSAAVPGARFFCEENERQDDLGSEHLFIIDPIDGTMNFVHHLDHSAISVAYLHRGSLEAAAVFDPYKDECFTALRGQGAFCNGRRIRVTEAPLTESLIFFGSAPYATELTERTFRLAERSYRTGLDVRRQGSAALDLCDVAAGRAGAYFELSISLWDYAAGALIVTEAGGQVTDIDGGPLPWRGVKTSILAASPKNAAAFLAMARD